MNTWLGQNEYKRYLKDATMNTKGKIDKNDNCRPNNQERKKLH